MLRKQHVDKLVEGIWLPEDVQIFTYNGRMFDSDFKIIYSFEVGYRKMTKRGVLLDIRIQYDGGHHTVYNNGQQNWGVYFTKTHYDNTKHSINRNQQKYDYYCESRFVKYVLYRVPKTLLVLWDEGLSACYKRAYIGVLIALKQRVPTEIALIILRAALELYKTDYNNYYL